jgi:hypothetical protein
MNLHEYQSKRRFARYGRHGANRRYDASVPILRKPRLQDSNCDRLHSTARPEMAQFDRLLRDRVLCLTQGSSTRQPGNADTLSVCSN